MRHKLFYGLGLLSVTLWCALPTTAWAHRLGVFGGIGLPGVALNVAIGVPVRSYSPYAYRSPVVVAPGWYPPVLYPSPSVVYPAPPIIYSSPVVVQPIPPPAATATLQILVAPLLADIYLNGRYIGRAAEFRDGLVQLNVSPGSHTVELRFGTVTQTHTVTVGAGTTAVVNDRLS